LNASQISYEWPALFLDTVEWVQHPQKPGVFFHEENVFSLWTMKVMEFDESKHMVVFLCIDYTIWPGWNHRGVYLYSREKEFKVGQSCQGFALIGWNPDVADASSILP